jgi:uncharacterized protein (DUF1800 family)
MKSTACLTPGCKDAVLEAMTGLASAASAQGPRLRRVGMVLLLAVSAALARADDPRLFNISTRGQVGTGADIMIAGFVIGKGTDDTVLIRAVGPSLAELVPQGITGLLQAPVLTIFDSSGAILQSNQGWTTGNATAAIMASAGAFPLLPGSTDSALVMTLPAGAYTAQVTGAGATSGLALLEIYEVGTPTPLTARLVNLSTRGQVGTSGNIMIPGFSIGPGTENKSLLIRAAGPALEALGIPGALLDPAISVVDNTGNTIASNDNWGTPVGNDAKTAAALETAFTSAGAFAFGVDSLDSALIGTFPPGNYTVLVTGNNNSTGIALVEVYDITPNNPDSVTIQATQANADTSGANPGAFSVVRTGDDSEALTINYSIGGTAVDGIDYQGLSGVVTIPAGATSAPIPVTPNASLSGASSSTVVLTLGAATGTNSYTLGAATTATVTITNIPPTLYIAQIRPTANASGSTGTGVATILVSADGSLASVSMTFSNLSSDEVVAHLAIGGDMNNGTYVLNLPDGQVTNLQWTPTGAGQYSASQVVAALTSGNLFIEIDSSQFPGGELGGQFITGAGSKIFTPPPPAPQIDLSSVSDADAPRFLTQATFGVTTTDIATLQSQGYAAWIANQMAIPETSHRSATDADFAAYPASTQTVASQQNRQAAWWLISLTAPDQLRQRVAFALSETFVTSDVATSLSAEADGLANYYDLLANDAFGNFRMLLNDVSLSPAMGNYLNMLRNAKANAAKGTSADENYAREVQQLFTIGLSELQPDGTLVLDSNGLPIPTYDQDEIVQMANALTGWGYYSSVANPSFYGSAADFNDPMMSYAAYHDETQKVIVNGTTIPANQTAPQDLQMVLDTLFNHPNTGPFICSQLIQRLVTSNPSPAYVYRVSQVFANDGTGTRGNLAAVVKAILLDYEARSLTEVNNSGFGKLKEPLLRVTQLYRGFNAASSEGRFPIFDPETSLDQAALRAPTVFNFFDPDYVQPGSLAAAGLLAPEFQITTATTVVSVPNLLYSYIYTSASPSAGTVVLNLAPLTANATNPTAMIATLNQLMCGGEMSTQTQGLIETELKSLPSSTTALALSQAALYLTATSPDAAIQR